MTQELPMIYLDHAATTPLDPEVAAAMQPYLTGSRFGNASSIHRYGREARTAVDEARDAVAALIRADYSELYFTGGGTESDNLALIGGMLAAPTDRNHLVTSAIEHHAVLHSAHFLRTLGYEVTTVPVDADGLVSPDAVAAAMTERTALVSIMHANNEIGVVQPIKEIAGIAHAGGAKFHTDAVQTVGMLPVNVGELDCDLLTLCAHKIYGPKGIGALYIRQGTKVSPILHGGSQEREKRAGTENVGAIVGFGKAAEIAADRRDADASHLISLRERFLSGLRDAVPGLHLNGHAVKRLPNNVNISVEGLEGTTLLMNLDRLGVAASSGSACSSGSIEPSHVLAAIGLSPTLASSGIRFTPGRGTTEAEIESATEIFARIVCKLRR